MNQQTYFKNERNFGCRISEFIFRGMRTVVLENETLRVGILADKGTDIFEFLHKPTDTDFMWRSWLGLRDPRHYIPTSNASAGAFTDHYFGGWQELFPNADEPCIYKGAELGLHGEVCLVPWDYEIIEDSPDHIAVRFSVATYRTPFRLTKIMHMYTGESFLEIEETVTNEGQEEMDFMWGQHPALGEPFLGKDCVISFPACRVRTDAVLSSPFSRIAPDQNVEWPFVTGMHGEKIDLRKIPGKEADCNDRVVMYGYDKGWYAVTNTVKHVGFGMQFDKSAFPYMLYWQSFAGWKGFPFYGNAYTMALEPRSSFPFPLTRVIENQTQVKLQPNTSVTTRYKAMAYQTDREYVQISDSGDLITS